MNEDHGMATREDKIGIAGKITTVQSEAKSERVNEPSNDNLRFRIFGAN
jgi:hypothetical protein